MDLPGYGTQIELSSIFVAFLVMSDVIVETWT